MIGYGLFPSWSPDKGVDRIAFQRARQRGSRWFSLWTLDLIDGEARRMTEVAVSSNAAIVSPCWSPDGSGWRSRPSIVEPAQPRERQGPPPVGQQDVWAIDADGGNRQRPGSDGNGPTCPRAGRPKPGLLRQRPRRHRMRLVRPGGRAPKQCGRRCEPRPTAPGRSQLGARRRRKPPRTRPRKSSGRIPAGPGTEVGSHPTRES